MTLFDTDEFIKREQLLTEIIQADERDDLYYKSRYRRYYLHRRPKKYFEVDARKRQVNITEKELENLPNLYRSYLDELAGMGYNIQFRINQ